MAASLIDLKTLRDKSIAYDAENTSLLRDAFNEMQENVQVMTNLRTTESRLKKELLKCTEENRELKESFTQLKRESSPLRQKTVSTEGKYKELLDKFDIQEKLRQEAEATIARLMQDASQYKKAAEDIKMLYEQSETKFSHTREELNTELKKREERFNNEKSEADKKVTEMREEIYKTMSNLREVESAANRYEKDLNKLTAELETVKEQLVQKDSDLRSTLTTLHENQKQACQAAEEKGGLRAEVSSLQMRLQLIEEERLSTATQLATYSSSIKMLELKVADKEAQILASKESVMQLEIEKELRSRCEVREEAERRERIAACAQLMATQTDCNKRVHDLEMNLQQVSNDFKLEVGVITKERDETKDESRRQADVIMGLESEVQQLRHALENASSSANQESVEQLGKLTGELEILRRRMRETTEMKNTEGVAALQRINQLEEQLKAGEIQRRRLHNLVQELRGNVRVFARVRPFLPNDGVNITSGGAPPDSSIAVFDDGAALKIAKKASGTHGCGDRAEEFSFTFDKVFGPSSSQESVFQEVSEFVQSALDGYNVCLFSCKLSI